MHCTPLKFSSVSTWILCGKTGRPSVCVNDLTIWAVGHHVTVGQAPHDVRVATCNPGNQQMSVNCDGAWSSLPNEVHSPWAEGYALSIRHPKHAHSRLSLVFFSVFFWFVVFFVVFWFSCFWFVVFGFWVLGFVFVFQQQPPPRRNPLPPPPSVQGQH